MKHKFIRCEDGSYLLIRNITRLFVNEDVISKTAVIKASTIGPAQPFVVAKFTDTDTASMNLVDLIDRIEGKDPTQYG